MYESLSSSSNVGFSAIRSGAEPGREQSSVRAPPTNFASQFTFTRVRRDFSAMSWDPKHGCEESCVSSGSTMLVQDPCRAYAPRVPLGAYRGVPLGGNSAKGNNSFKALLHSAQRFLVTSNETHVAFFASCTNATKCPLQTNTVRQPASCKDVLLCFELLRTLTSIILSQPGRQNEEHSFCVCAAWWGV